MFIKRLEVVRKVGKVRKVGSS